MKRSIRKRHSNSHKHQSKIRIGCLIALIVFIPIGYGIYLYYQQNNLCVTPQKQYFSTSTSQPSNHSIGKEKPLNNNRVQKNYGIQDLMIPQTPVSYTSQLIKHTGYYVSYNQDFCLPNWVSYELTRQETKGKEKRSNRFIPDPIAKGAHATNNDYKHSGYDKGHMAPAGDMKWSKKTMDESFYFTNICPQHPQLNRRAWKMLEEKIRDWAVADSALIIICGPITPPHPQRIGTEKIAVPTYFFKVILAPYAKPIRAIAFLFKNKKSVEPISTYAVTVDSIEELTGMDFFTILPDDIENKIEASVNIQEWPN